MRVSRVLATLRFRVHGQCPLCSVRGWKKAGIPELRVVLVVEGGLARELAGLVSVFTERFHWRAVVGRVEEQRLNAFAAREGDPGHCPDDGGEFGGCGLGDDHSTTAWMVRSLFW